ncbi:beta-1,3-galactosyltransferase GALT1 [Heracleum sosnowskyi]|uniref:Beta-1,3-galactosyltransferase GALT1 n=1 Tax=Heracleum sosnowskyi TaxID=360622 RepID=A0AAD8IDD9_9APIA|nr:beta-1,3-galactosyltransferase GALT1 [Heracleum sosnowskyi]
MTKWFSGALIGLLIIGFILSDEVIYSRNEKSLFYRHVSLNTSDTQNLLKTEAPTDVSSPQASHQVFSADIISSNLFVQRNFSQKVQTSLQTWEFMKDISKTIQGLDNAIDAISEAGHVWDTLVNSFDKGEIGDVPNNMLKAKENKCPYYLNMMNATKFDDKGYTIHIPCGLIRGSSISVIGIPNGLLGNFQIDLIGEPLADEPTPPLVLHYSVRLNGDELTADPVIVQNTWTAGGGWGEEERCPRAVPGKINKADGLNQCNLMTGRNDSLKLTSDGTSTNLIWSSGVQKRFKPRKYFPFKKGYPSVMTLRAGEVGLQAIVDGKYATSFAFRKRFEPWLINKVQISGEFELISALATGLPTSEDVDNIIDLDVLRAGPLVLLPLDLFIGVFSTATNFKHRMSIRRTWMQYDAVKSGSVAVRFFVGLHKSQMVNEELWDEVHTYEDIQLMPFTDYYDLITLKSLATCIFGTQVASAKYVMKTDDDSFVRVDEVIASLERLKVREGLLYGLIDSHSRPQRNHDSKWYISPEEWPEETYPPWAHGPGYVVSGDIAHTIYKRYKRGDLKMFKLEDVAMGLWIADMRKKGLEVSFINEPRIYIEGCKDGYIVAHYQSPRQMLCLWHKLQLGKGAICCGKL